MHLFLDVYGPPEPPAYNLETIYASVIGIIFVIGVVWFLLFLRPDIVPNHIRAFMRDCVTLASEHKCTYVEEVTSMECVVCGVEKENGVIIANEFYCSKCALSSEAIMKATEQYKQGRA